jgi:hypothetical protein
MDWETPRDSEAADAWGWTESLAAKREEADRTVLVPNRQQ